MYYHDVFEDRPETWKKENLFLKHEWVSIIKFYFINVYHLIT